MSDVIKDFQRHPDIAPCKSVYDLNPSRWKSYYRHDYLAIFRDIKAGKIPYRETFAQLIRSDLFFIVHFIMAIPKANHPFIVEVCRMVESDQQSGTIDVWAREHFKSTVITIGNTVKRIVNNPESTTAIFSFKKPAAEKFLDSVRRVLESKIMVWAFPGILYEKPATEAMSWSLQGGIRVKRQSTARKEHTVEAYGLIEGMPTGIHVDHRIYDDVETADLAMNPDQLDLLMERFEMSRNLGSEGGTEQIIGTYYSHCGFLVRLGEKKDIHGKQMYKLRLKPATVDGTITGAPVFFSQDYLDSKKTDSTFNSQQLCNPTPTHDVKLKFERFVPVPRHKLPKNRIKIVIIDPAGDDDVQVGSKNDSWAMLCLGVKPVMDELGLSDVYIEDAITGEMGSSESQDAACSIYMRNGRIAMLAVERVATDSAWLHVKNALAARGRYLELKKPGSFGGNLMLLSPSGRKKNKKIVDNLEWPLNNSKLHIVDDLPPEIVQQLQSECNKFPFFHVDILDALSYLYDVLADPTFRFDCDDEDEYNVYEDQYTGRSGVAGY